MMISNLIILTFNVILSCLVCFRVGRQSIFTNLLNKYKEVCEDNEKLLIIIQDLYKKLDVYEEIRKNSGYIINTTFLKETGNIIHGDSN